MLSRAFAKGIRKMKNLTKLGFLLSVGTIAAFSAGGCSSDNGGTTTPAAGTSAGGSSAGTGTSGTATGGSTAGTGTSGTATGGSSAGTGTSGTATGGGGAGGGGAGGASGGGAGGASGGGAGGASGGGAGGSGGAPSAACTMWCVGDSSVVTVCSANNLPAKIATSDLCLAECAKAPPASVTCWNTHTANAKTGDKGMHCPHAEGAPGNGVCPELP
jgi:hypothetical protein